jgi:hypothetical protein
MVKKFTYKKGLERFWGGIRDLPRNNIKKYLKNQDMYSSNARTQKTAKTAHFGFKMWIIGVPRTQEQDSSSC